VLARLVWKLVSIGSQQTKNKGLLVYNAVIHSKLPLANRSLLFHMIGDERIKTKAQLDAAIEFLVSVGESWTFFFHSSALLM